MKSSLQAIFKHFPATFLLVFVSLVAAAQKPIIRSIVKNKGSMGETVSINGNNFGADASKLIVFFGASKATIISAADQLLEVQIPSGATYDYVSVERVQASGPSLIGYSNESFLLSFGGNHPFSATNLDAQQDFAAEKGLYDLCACDFNDDKKIDIVSANKSSNNVEISMNNSSPGTLAFTTQLIPIAAKTLHVTCGDLNGDGKPDIVATSGANDKRIFILQNAGGGVFNLQTLFLDLDGTQKVKIADLDLDGKPELIVTHKKDPGTISILKNKTTTSSITFDSPINIAVTGALTTDGLEVTDLNGDLLPEIITSQSQTNNSNLFIIQNKSTTGTLSFGSVNKLTIAGAVVNIKSGDLDGDGKPDIAVTQLLGNSLSIFLNQSSGSTFTFSTPTTLPTEATPWGLDFGDMDGDGKTDIVIGSVTKTNLTILNNESTAGNLSFTRILIPTTIISRHVIIGDVDTDGKPDIAFTSIDDATLTDQKISIFKNKACMMPSITPDEPISVCQGATLKLQTTVSNGATYTWKDVTNNTSVGTNDPFFTVPTGSLSTTKYSVTVNPQGGISCPTSTKEVIVTVGNGSAAVPTFVSPPTPTGPVCTGSTLQLEVNTQAGKQFSWTGPNNYTGSGPSISIANFQSSQAGKYTVSVSDQLSNCVAQQASIVVESIDAQNFTINFSGSDLICQGEKKPLQISPTSGTFSYKWFKNSIELTGRNYDSLQVSSSGDYYAAITIPNCGTISSNTQKITVASKPVVNFSMNPSATACSGQDITFTNQTTNLDPSQEVIYKWDFGDGNISSDKDTKHKYNVSSSTAFNIKLTVSYPDNVCLQETQPPLPQITVKPAPAATISSTNHPDFKFCKGETITLKIDGSFNSYHWSNGAEGVASIDVEDGGIYSVEVTTNECTLNAEQNVISLEPHITVSADPSQINEGQSSQLNASGLQDYTWSPGETLSDASIPNPVATPTVTTSYTVSGNDDNGCHGEAIVEIQVIGEPIVNKLKPTNFFSPNGKGPNEVWTVEKIAEYPQCNIAIYDIKGIKVFEAKPYNNDWDGTFQGKKLPEGVYYYVIRCEGEENKTKSGSITLLR